MNALIRFQHVRRPHWLLRDKAPSVLPEAEEFWEHLMPATKGIIAWCDCDACMQHGESVVRGFLRYQGSDDVSELGTWVRPSSRGFGIATRLWDEMVRVEKPKKIHATTVTKGGKKFVAALKKRFADVKWTVKDKT